jgi:glycosidase
MPKTYPTHWWVGMKNSFVQVMLQGDNIGDASITLAYPGVKLLKVHKLENKNYLFADVLISSVAKPGTLFFSMKNAGKTQRLPFPLKMRRKGNGSSYAQGVNSKDLMYLIMPDRFSNGDPSNDQVPGMKDQSLRRDTVYNRHGGDLKGVENKIDYLKELGVTAIWLNPIIENDMPTRTEHGYAFTNHYKVDPRLGGDAAYKSLIDAAHKKGVKIIQDAVYNHVGVHHHTVVDPPMKDWLHQWPTYTNTTYKDQVLFDPYASKKDVSIMADGWFTREMPDLNHNNPYVVNFLIQHAIWTVEEFGIDGWRIDTYAYNDLEFMNRCNKALETEFPSITMFGETWVHGVPNQSYFCENIYNTPFKSNLQAVTDFQTLWGITDAMTKDFGWNDGVNKLYTTLAQDFVYKDPMRNVIFLDNHDLSRFYSVIGEHIEKYKSSLSWLLTCRGIPQLYYGAEVNMTGVTSPNDGFVRQDFPGGWPSDAVNKFTAEGRVGNDQQIWNHIAALAKFRKNSSAITTGKMMQFVPEDGVYVYFRYNAQQTVMVVMNTSKEKRMVSVAKYAERTKGFTTAKNVVNKESNTLADFSLEPHQSVVLELMK